MPGPHCIIYIPEARVPELSFFLLQPELRLGIAFEVLNATSQARVNAMQVRSTVPG